MLIKMWAPSFLYLARLKISGYIGEISDIGPARYDNLYRLCRPDTISFTNYGLTDISTIFYNYSRNIVIFWKFTDFSNIGYRIGPIQ